MRTSNPAFESRRACAAARARSAVRSDPHPPAPTEGLTTTSPVPAAIAVSSASRVSGPGVCRPGPEEVSSGFGFVGTAPSKPSQKNSSLVAK